MKHLYEFTSEYLQAFEAIEYDEETGQLVGWEALEALNVGLEDKMEAVACYIKDRERLAADIKAEEAALVKRRKAIENEVAGLKGYLAQNMEQTGKTGLETAKCKIGFRRSSRVEIVDEDKLPAAYWVVTETRRPDKAALKKLLGQGGEVTGAKLVESRNLYVS